MYAIPFDKSFMHVILVLPNTVLQIVRYANVEGSILLACHDVDVVGLQRFSFLSQATDMDSRLRGNDSGSYSKRAADGDGFPLHAFAGAGISRE